MRRLLFVTLLCMASVLGFGSLAPTHAQDGGKLAGPPQYQPTEDAEALAQPINGPPTPDPVDFVLLEGGMIIVDGDTNTHCRWFASDLEQGFHRNLDQGLARRVLEQCEQAGLSTSSAQATLPDTGGPDFFPWAVTGWALLLMRLGVSKLVARGDIRRGAE